MHPSVAPSVAFSETEFASRVDSIFMLISKDRNCTSQEELFGPYKLCATDEEPRSRVLAASSFGFGMRSQERLNFVGLSDTKMTVKRRLRQVKRSHRHSRR